MRKDQMWAKGDGGFTDQVPLLNYWWMWTMQSQYWLCFPWFPLEIRLFLSQKVMEFPIRVYVEGLVPNQLGHGHLPDPVRQPNPSAVQTQALQRPFRTLPPELSPISILHSLSTSRSPATCGLSFLLAWVKTINTLQDYWRLPPPSFTISSMPGP